MMTNFPDCESVIMVFLVFFSILPSLTLRIARGDLEDSDLMGGDLGLEVGGEDDMLLVVEMSFEGLKSSLGRIWVFAAPGLLSHAVGSAGNIGVEKSVDGACSFVKKLLTYGAMSAIWLAS